MCSYNVLFSPALAARACLYVQAPCLPHDRPMNPEMKCWGKQWRLYLESQKMKMVDWCSKTPSCPDLDASFF